MRKGIEVKERPMSSILDRTRELPELCHSLADIELLLERRGGASASDEQIEAAVREYLSSYPKLSRDTVWDLLEGGLLDEVAVSALARIVREVFKWRD
jgi:hypothetical protein